MNNSNKQQYQHIEEEISLRELIEALWKGKRLIIGITIFAMVASLVFSFLIVSPTYEVQSSLIVKNSSGTGSASFVASLIEDQAISLDTLLSAFNNIITGPKLLAEVRKISPDWEEIDSDSLKDLISIQLVEKTTNVNITTKASSPQDVVALANLVTNRFREFIQEQNYDYLSTKLQTAKFQMESDIALYQERINRNEAQLAELDKVLVYKKSIVEDPYLQQLAAALGNTSVINISNLSVESESPNPAYLRVLDDITSNRLSLNNLESQYNELVKAENSLEQLAKDSGLKATVAREVVEPVNPIAPRKALNLAIATVLGLMLGVFIVFAMDYWKKSGEQVKVDGAISIN